MRTPEEWAYLIKELRKVADNPAETRERRVKARDILDRIERSRGPSRTAMAKAQSSDRRSTEWKSPLGDIEYGVIV